MSLWSVYSPLLLHRADVASRRPNFMCLNIFPLCKSVLKSHTNFMIMRSRRYSCGSASLGYLKVVLWEQGGIDPSPLRLWRRFLLNFERMLSSSPLFRAPFCSTARKKISRNVLRFDKVWNKPEITLSRIPAFHYPEPENRLLGGAIRRSESSFRVLPSSTSSSLMHLTSRTRSLVTWSRRLAW